MLMTKIYCLFKQKPEEISGFADFEKRLKKSGIEIEVIDVRTYESYRIKNFFSKNSVLVTDSRIDADIPTVGFLTDENKHLPGYKYLFESFEGMTADYFRMAYARYYKIPLVILETERLLVREIKLDDLDCLYEIYEEPSITEYMEDLYPNKEDEIEFTKSYIENMYAFYGYGMWIVIEKESSRIIGRAGLGNRELDGEMYLELGYVIAKSCQNRGYATEVSKAIIEYAGRELGGDRIISLIKPGNKQSIRVAQKLGFKEIAEVTCDGEQYLEYLLEPDKQTIRVQVHI